MWKADDQREQVLVPLFTIRLLLTDMLAPERLLELKADDA